jgi:hypothetical protein
MEAAKAMRIQDRLLATEPPAAANPAPVRRRSTQSGAAMLRPSSARRLANLHALVAEFGERDLGRSGVAALLGCSMSASRNYLAALSNARVVFLQPGVPASGYGDRMLYRLTADALAVHDFLAGLAGPFGTSEANLASPPGQVRRIWRDSESFVCDRAVPARRDPLVAALFGAAGHS